MFKYVKQLTSLVAMVAVLFTFTTETMALWEHGFIEINFLDEDPMVTLTDKALNAKEIMQLDKSQQYTLKEIIRIVLQQK